MADQPQIEPDSSPGRGRSGPCVLVVDDEADIRELLELTLIRMGLGVELAGSVAEAKSVLKRRHIDLCLTDMRLPDAEGLELVRHVAAVCNDVPIAVITAYGSAENAVAALKAGAFDYLTKPVSLGQLRTLVKSALAVPSRAGEHREARLVGQSEAIEQVRSLIGRLARSQAPVYVSGESGSGKELAARLIHDKGPRADKPFVPVNCGAIPETLVESEFFGYRKGAFTGADNDREGVFQAANGGSLFLDEVAELPMAMQVRLLRAIQEKKVRRVGSTQEEPVDVRIISATHANLAARVESGQFRQDLYYRLAVIELRMPSLREHKEDLPLLVNSVLKHLAGDAPMPQVSASALKALMEYEFPGNVRELENILERAMALSSGAEIRPEDLQLQPHALDATGEVPDSPGSRWPLQDYLDRVEREAILQALAQTRFNRTAAAKILGITFRALRYRMARLGIQ